MADDLTSCDELGRSVAAGLDAYGAERTVAMQAARRGFLDVALQRSTPTREPVRRSFIGLGLALSVCALAVTLWVVRATRPLVFTADGQAGALQSWVAAPGDRAVPLRFSDGTEIRVEPSSRVRVLALEQHGASITLENGALHAEVVHTGESAWLVVAGPLTVRVTGTRFDLAWSAATEEFSVTVIEGSVGVSGALVGAERAVRAGETLHVVLGERRMELMRLGAPDLHAVPLPALSNEESANAVPADAAARVAAKASPAAAPSARIAEWRVYAREGLLRKAFLSAETTGFDTACQTASASELLLLGDGARLSGRGDRATQALMTLREHYPSDPRRAAAAFALGKVTFDQNRDYARAATWFRTSLQEQPSGSLSREASGRLIEALSKSGDANGARRAAEDYLHVYPDGPHADIARALLR